MTFADWISGYLIVSGWLCCVSNVDAPRTSAQVPSGVGAVLVGTLMLLVGPILTLVGFFIGLFHLGGRQ